MFPVALALHLVAAFDWTAPDTHVWADTSAAIVMGSILSGPFVASIAAWQGSREWRAKAEYLRETSPRPSYQGALVEVASLAVWALASYVLTALVLVVDTAREATWGSPDYLWLLAGGCGLLVFVAFGFVLGRVWPRPYTPPIVGVMLYLAVSVNARGFGEPWYFLAPAVMQRTTPFLAIDHSVVLWQIVWYLAISSTVLVLWAVLRLKARSHLATTALACSMVASLVGGGYLSATDTLFSGDSQFTRTCSGVRPAICVHPAYSSALPMLRMEFGPVLGRLAGTPLWPVRLEQDLRGRTSGVDGTVVFAFDDIRPGFARQAVAEFVGTIVPVIQCARVPPDDPRHDAVLSQAAVRSWLSNDFSLLEASPGPTLAAARWLAGMGESASQKWLTKHVMEISTCALSLDDFQ